MPTPANVRVPLIRQARHSVDAAAASSDDVVVEELGEGGEVRFLKDDGMRFDMMV